MDFNCDYCGRGHDEESNNHDCNHSLCFTCDNRVDGCPKCEAEIRVVTNAEREERERREAEETRINAVTECCICMDTIQITNRAVTGCGHVFCLGCLLQHLRAKNDCPMCRRTVGPPPSRSTGLTTFGDILDSVLSNDALYQFIATSMAVFGPQRQQVPRQEPRRQQVPRQRELSRCGICRQYGHNRRTCNQVREQVNGV